MVSQRDKANTFWQLHQKKEAFIVPNPWSPGTARLLVSFGFPALATTSAGYAFSQGLPDNGVGREQMMRHLGEISAATDLPVTADLENGFGDSPNIVAETIRLAAAAGVVGGSIEDVISQPSALLYSVEHAAERVRAAAEAARSLSFPFMLTARAENFMVGFPDLKGTIKRLQAYQDAGADVLFAPGLRTKGDIAAVVGAVDRPVKVMIGLPGVHLTKQELAEIGVKRISVGGALCRVALGAFHRAGLELRNQGSFISADQGLPFKEINSYFQGWQA